MSVTPAAVSTGLPHSSSQSQVEQPGQVELITLHQRGSNASIKISTTPVSEPRTKTELRNGRIQFATLCWTLFLVGYNDGSTGPLLPRVQSVYHANFTIVSLIFVFSTIGFVLGALSNVALMDKLGFGTVMVIGSVSQLIAYSIASPAPPFPVLVLAYAINGFGVALQDSGANGYVASIKHGAATKMGILHAVYGAGALVSPLIATQFAQLPRWSFHFLTSMGIALANTALLVTVFRFKTQDECLAQAGQQPEGTPTNSGSKYSFILKTKEVHLLATFILAYIGVEVTLGGWIVTYIIDERGGGPSSGYISSGFFGGLALGRVALLWFNKLIGERLVVFIYAALAIGLELIVWLVPSLIGDGIAISFIGFVLGPIYPIVMNHSARILPSWILTGSIGWIAGFGVAGSACIPFITGVIASHKGIESLQPLLVTLTSVMLVLWLLVPASPRKTD